MYPMVLFCPCCGNYRIAEVEEEPKHGVVTDACDECEAAMATDEHVEQVDETLAEKAYYASLEELDNNPRYQDAFACLGYGFRASEY